VREKISILIGVCAGLIISTQSADATQVVLSPEKDNSIFEDGVNNSSSVGDFIYAGTTGNRNGAGPSFRRGLIQFDIASFVPSEATITSATLTLTIGKDPDEKEVGTTQTLHRVTTAWGATDSPGSGVSLTPGKGTAAETGDATWNQALFGSTDWNTVGGDYVATASASIGVSPIINQAMNWSSLGMLSDIQLWLDNPEQNAGWIIIGNENFTKNARGYYSMDNTDPSAVGRAPKLTIEYTIVPEPAMLSLLFGLTALCVISRRRGSKING